MQIGTLFFVPLQVDYSISLTVNCECKTYRFINVLSTFRTKLRPYPLKVQPNLPKISQYTCISLTEPSSGQCTFVQMLVACESDIKFSGFKNIAAKKFDKKFHMSLNFMTRTFVLGWNLYRFRSVILPNGYQWDPTGQPLLFELCDRWGTA